MLHQWAGFVETGVPDDLICRLQGVQHSQPRGAPSPKVNAASRPCSPPKWPGDIREGAFRQVHSRREESIPACEHDVLIGTTAPLHVAPIRRECLRSASCAPAAKPPVLAPLPPLHTFVPRNVVIENGEWANAS